MQPSTRTQPHQQQQQQQQPHVHQHGHAQQRAQQRGGGGPSLELVESAMVMEPRCSLELVESAMVMEPRCSGRAPQWSQVREPTLAAALLPSTKVTIGFGKPPLESRPKTAARLGLEVATGCACESSRPHVHSDATVAKRYARGFRVGGRSRGRFATPADFPLHDGTPCSHIHVRRGSLGFVHR
jgi:hypothetical protein